MKLLDWVKLGCRETGCERCPACGGHFHGKSHSHGVRYLPRPTTPMPPPAAPAPPYVR